MKIAIICALLAGKLKIQNLTFYLNWIVFQFYLSFLLILIWFYNLFVYLSFSCLLSWGRWDHWYHTTSCPMPRLLVQRKSWWKLRIPLLQPIQPTLLPPMLKRISLLSSLLAIVSRIQWRMQPMFVRSIRRLCHHRAMDTSHHLWMPRPMSPSWTPLQWKHCWPK